MEKIEWICHGKRQAHARCCSDLSPDEIIKTTISLLAVWHYEVLDFVIEGYLEKDLNPLSVNLRHDSSAQGIHSLCLGNVLQ